MMPMQKNSSFILSLVLFLFPTNCIPANKSTQRTQGDQSPIVNVGPGGKSTINYGTPVTVPLFDLYINGIAIPVRDHEVIKLPPNRMIGIRVQNVGQTPTDNLSISVYVPLELSNLTFTGWTQQAPPINPKTKQEVNGLLHLWSVAAGVVPAHGWFRSPLLTISKDLPPPVYTKHALKELGFEFSGSATKAHDDFAFRVLPVIVSVNSSQSTEHRLNLFFAY